MHPRWGEVVHVCVIAPEFLHYLFDDDYVDDQEDFHDGDVGGQGDDDECCPDLFVQVSPVVRPIHPRASIATRLLTWKVSCSEVFF